MVFENTCSIVVAVCLVTRVDLFIVGIIPNRNIVFKKLFTILLLSESRRFMLKLMLKTSFFVKTRF